MLDIGLKDGFLTISELNVSSARQNFTTVGVICGFIFSFDWLTGDLSIQGKVLQAEHSIQSVLSLLATF